MSRPADPTPEAHSRPLELPAPAVISGTALVPADAEHGPHQLSLQRARGKVILLGEHAVVYGQPALVCALELATTVRVGISSREDPLWLEAPALSFSGPLPVSPAGPADVRKLAAAVLGLLERLDLPAAGLRLEISSELPPGRGLGSSAALSVALVRALWALRTGAREGNPAPQDLRGALDASSGGAPAPELLIELARAVEASFHGRSSGLDVAAAALGGLLRFVTGEPPEIAPLSCAVPLEGVLLDSGEAGCTATQVARAALRLKADRGAGDAWLQAVGGLVDAGARAIAAGRLESLGRCLDENHRLLQGLGVSTPGLDALVALSRRAGALGAKLTGAGGGGMVLALCPGRQEKVLSAARQAGVSAFAVQIPPRPGNGVIP